MNKTTVASSLARKERIRIEHQLQSVINAVDAAKRAMACGGQIGYDTIEGLRSAVDRIVIAIARHDAFVQAEHTEEKATEGE